MEYPLISIQILNWNRAMETQRAIQSAFDQTYPNIEIVLVDNGSTDESVELARKNFPSIIIVELDKNYGCPGGRNMGVRYCSGDYIFYLDNDGVLHNEAVWNAYQSFLRYKKVGVVTGIVYDFDSDFEINTKCSVANNVQYFHNNFQGGICMHDRSIYAQTGMYPSHFMYGSEEYFLSIKLFEAGFNIVKDESVILWHRRSLIARNRFAELEYGYYNRLYVVVSLFPFVPALLFVAYFLPVYFYYSYKAGFFNTYLKRFWKRFPSTLYSAITHRKPIKYSTYRRFKDFSS